MKLNYCPECATELQKISNTNYACANGHPYYNNPRAAVSLVLLRKENRQILFAKRAHEPAQGKYDLPGGFLDYGENAYQAALREAREEMGIELDEENLELVHTSSNMYLENIATCDIVIICHEWQGDPKANDDVAALEWKPIEFIDSPKFAWSYSRLVGKLQKYLAKKTFEQ